MSIKILNPGLFSTIQDQGRIGFQNQGFSNAGVLDQYAYRLGQTLIGNNGPAIECTIIGPTLQFLEDNSFIITGAQFNAKINDGDMAEFVYFKNACRMWYPVGQYFSSDNFGYIREAASSINKVFPTGKLILVVRGHSGSILAGSIAYILKRKGREVLISVSRKAESTHGDNLEGISSYTVSSDTHIIVVDDFVQTGETIEAILKDLTERIEDMKVFDMLCVANHWDEGDLTDEGGKRGTNRYWEANRRIASHFEYILSE